MNSMFITAQVFGLLGTITNIIGIQMKRKDKILLLFMLANILFAVNFALLAAYSGAIICGIAAVQTFINYTYDKKKKAFPKFLIPIYIIVSLAGGAFAYNTLVDVLPIICSILYTLLIINKKEKNIRMISFINILIWLIYDVIVGAYAAMISDFIFISSNIIAIYRYDIKKEHVIADKP